MYLFNHNDILKNCLPKFHNFCRVLFSRGIEEAVIGDEGRDSAGGCSYLVARATTSGEE